MTLEQRYISWWRIIFHSGINSHSDRWVDSFDEDDDGLWLSGTDNEIDVIVAWMEIPPYKEEQ